MLLPFEVKSLTDLQGTFVQLILEVLFGRMLCNEMLPHVITRPVQSAISSLDRETTRLSGTTVRIFNGAQSVFVTRETM